MPAMSLPRQSRDSISSQLFLCLDWWVRTTPSPPPRARIAASPLLRRVLRRCQEAAA